MKVFCYSDVYYSNIPSTSINFIVLFKINCDNVSGHLFSLNSEREAHQVAKDRMNETYVDKWVTPTYLYNQSHYPLFVSGSCYVMTTLAASCLFEKAMTMPFFHLEDVFITGLVAEQCNITRINHIGSILFLFPETFVCYYYEVEK